jgi:hypothetical protein
MQGTFESNYRPEKSELLPASNRAASARRIAPNDRARWLRMTATCGGGATWSRMGGARTSCARWSRTVATGARRLSGDSQRGGRWGVSRWCAKIQFVVGSPPTARWQCAARWMPELGCRCRTSVIMQKVTELSERESKSRSGHVKGQKKMSVTKSRVRKMFAVYITCCNAIMIAVIAQVGGSFCPFYPRACSKETSSRDRREQRKATRTMNSRECRRD